MTRRRTSRATARRADVRRRVVARRARPVVADGCGGTTAERTDRTPRPRRWLLVAAPALAAVARRSPRSWSVPIELRGSVARRRRSRRAWSRERRRRRCRSATRTSTLDADSAVVMSPRAGTRACCSSAARRGSRSRRAASGRRSSSRAGDIVVRVVGTRFRVARSERANRRSRSSTASSTSSSAARGRTSAPASAGRRTPAGGGGADPRGGGAARARRAGAGDRARPGAHRAADRGTPIRAPAYVAHRRSRSRDTPSPSRRSLRRRSPSRRPPSRRPTRDDAEFDRLAALEPRDPAGGARRLPRAVARHEPVGRARAVSLPRASPPIATTARRDVARRSTSGVFRAARTPTTRSKLLGRLKGAR